MTVMTPTHHTPKTGAMRWEPRTGLGNGGGRRNNTGRRGNGNGNGGWDGMEGSSDESPMLIPISGKDADEKWTLGRMATAGIVGGVLITMVCVMYKFSAISSNVSSVQVTVQRGSR